MYTSNPYIETLTAKEILTEHSDIHSLAGIGTWSISFNNGDRYWSDEVFDIFDIKRGEMPSSEEVFAYFDEDSRDVLLQNVFMTRSFTHSWDLQLQMTTHTGDKKWVRSAGTPITNTNGEVIGIKGIFQDIDSFKKKELQLERSLSLSDNQKLQLERFAENITTSLASHADNFNVLLDAFVVAKTEDERSVILFQLQKVAATLEKNIIHLKAQLKAEQNVHHYRSRIRFEDVYDKVVQLLSLVITETGTIIETDLQAKEISYIPAYLESIFLNLISNAIKFRHPERTPYIYVRSFYENGKTYLEVKDNGVGINADHSVFDLTSSTDTTKGIGLYLVKSQVQALGGTITYESQPDEGSRFTIIF